MKGFLMALSILGVVFYVVHQSNPASKGGQSYGSGTGEAIVVTPSNFDLTVVSNPGPVLAYFWAPW